MQEGPGRHGPARHGSARGHPAALPADADSGPAAADDAAADDRATDEALSGVPRNARAVPGPVRPCRASAPLSSLEPGEPRRSGLGVGVAGPPAVAHRGALVELHRVSPAVTASHTYSKCAASRRAPPHTERDPASWVRAGSGTCRQLNRTGTRTTVGCSTPAFRPTARARSGTSASDLGVPPRRRHRRRRPVASGTSVLDVHRRS